MSSGGFGQQDPADEASEFNSTWFLVRQFLATVRGAAVVQIKSVTNSGGVSPIGTVDVLPLVNQLDGLGNSTPHGTIYGLPYARVQGGTNAVILDPVVGDIGIAVFCDRDISAVKATKAQANPGSFRRNDWADGVYLFTITGGTPQQYVEFTSTGITITDKSGNIITMASAGITINGVLFDRSANMSGVGTLHASGEGTFSGSHTVSEHTHGGVTTGGGTTATPTG